MSELNQYKGIIVEDTLAKGQVLQAMLEQLGLSEVLHFTSAEDGLRSIRKADSDTLLFLDLQLPGLSGQELIKKLGQDKFKGSVIISSACEQRIIDIALRSAATSGVRLLGALAQPYQAEQIEDLILNWKDSSPPRDHRNYPNLLDEDAIYIAFDEDRVEPFYQPIIDLESGTVVAIECLSRIWDEDKQEHLLPVSFLPRIINISFLDNLALRLFQKSLTNFAHPTLANSHIKLAMNIESSQLTSETFALSLNELANKHQLNPERIVYELTEKSPIDEQNQLETLNILRLKNYNIAIDDFGSGHTNLTDLRNIPFNQLKINRRLIAKAETDAFCQIAIESILALAKEVHAEVVAVGIETKEQLDYISQYEGIKVQGSFIAPALSFEHFLNWLEYCPYKLA